MKERFANLSSRKFIICMLVCGGALLANLLARLDSLHAAVLIGSVACLYIGGQSLVDAAKEVAVAKFGKG